MQNFAKRKHSWTIVETSRPGLQIRILLIPFAVLLAGFSERIHAGDEIIIDAAGTVDRKPVLWRISRTDIERISNSSVTTVDISLGQTDLLKLYEAAKLETNNNDVRRLLLAEPAFNRNEVSDQINLNSWSIFRIEMNRVDENKSWYKNPPPKYLSIFYIAFVFRSAEAEGVESIIYFLQDGTLIKKSTRDQTKEEIEELKEISERSGLNQ